MKRRRAFALLKWCATTACVGVLALAVASVWVRPLIGFRYGYISARHGNALVLWSAAASAKRDTYVAGPEILKVAPGFRLSLPRVSKVTSSASWGPHVTWGIVVPLWLLFILTGAPATYLWWRDRRWPARCCQHCGYDLTGNVSGRCPECGTPTSDAKLA